jgi:putative FmdB family regulatory protein
MPIYSYRCDHCGLQFDKRQKFSDEPLKVCPECGEEKLRKLYLPVGIVFKGSGFYATDHRSPSGQKVTHKSEKSDDSGKAETTGESENKSKSSASNENNS